MRFLLTSMFITILVFSVHAQEAPSKAVSLRTQMDSNLKNMIDIISTALLQKVPGVTKDSKIEISQDSSLVEGRAQGQWALSVSGSEETAPLFSMNGGVELNLISKDSIAGDSPNISLQIMTTAQISKEDLYKIMSLSYQKMGGDLQLFADPSVSTTVVMQKYKEQAMAYVQSFASTTPPKKKQSFGRGSPSPDSSSNSLDAETVSQLKAVIEQSMNVMEVNGETIVQIDTSSSRSVFSSIAKKNPILNVLMAFGSLDLKVAGSVVQWTVRSEVEVPAKVIETYDAYLSQQQSQETGLTELSELITKLGAWAVGRCSTEAYQTMCVDNLINVCTKNVDRVQKCVDEAKMIQSSRESNTSGDHISTIANGVSLLGSRTGTAIADWFSSDDEESSELGSN